MEKEEEIEVKQEQVHNILFSREPGWKDLIYDLINTEQIDPWDVDIILLTNKYLEKLQELEEADFFISSKVLLAASFLLRIKSEILLDKHIKSIDEILFGKEEKKKYQLERIETDEEIPNLTLRTPLPRFKRVTLKELIESLNKAIRTENRRIKKEIVNKNALRETNIVLPKRKFSIKDKIKEIYKRLIDHFNEKGEDRVSYSDFIGQGKEEKIASFASLLHLENQEKVWLEQENHFEEIYIWMKDSYIKNNPHVFDELKEDLEKQ